MKRETERLLGAYHERQDGTTKRQFARVRKHPVSREASQPETLQADPVLQMERLHATVQELDVDLVWELMAIYFVDESLQANSLLLETIARRLCSLSWPESGSLDD